MKPDRALLKTVIFSIAVVSFVIGIYQTLVTNNLAANYWIFMVSFSCWLLLRHWRQQEALAAKTEAQQPKSTPPAGRREPGAKPGRKRRGQA